MCKSLNRWMGAVIVASSLMMPGVLNSASAQEAGEADGVQNAQREDGFDWGWLGLLGLIGLAGLSGRNRHEARHTTTTEHAGMRP